MNNSALFETLDFGPDVGNGTNRQGTDREITPEGFFRITVRTGIKVEIMSILEGATYLCTSSIPRGCLGERYVAHRMVQSVPANQRMVLVEGVSGPEAGRWFVCSIQLFSRRYRLLDTTNAPLMGESDESVQAPIRMGGIRRADDAA